MNLKEIDKALIVLQKHIRDANRLNRDGLQAQLSTIRNALAPHRAMFDEQTDGADRFAVLRDARRFRALLENRTEAEDFGDLDEGEVALVVPNGIWRQGTERLIELIDRCIETWGY